MNRKETFEWLEWYKRNAPALAAFAAGKEIQLKYARREAIRLTAHTEEWNDVRQALFSLDHEYRVKPVPRVITYIEYTNDAGKSWAAWNTLHGDKHSHAVEASIQNCLRTNHEVRTIEFVEKLS